MAAEEIFPIVDPSGNVVGSATRAVCHSGIKLLHPVVHLHVRDSKGRLYLQKRAMTKDIQPGKWDTAVGGHVDYGEDVETALLREAREELGLTGIRPMKLFSYVFESQVESELVNTFAIEAEACAITIDPAEIEEGRFWELAEIDASLGKGIFTPNFEQEYTKLRQIWA